MEDEKRYWVGFNLASGIGGARINKLIDYFGDLERAWFARPEELGSMGLPRNVVENLLDLRVKVDLDKEMARIREAGYEVITWKDPNYPERLRELEWPPPVIYAWGEIAPKDKWAVAVVGTRRSTPYGRGLAQEIASTLASSGISVISGLARGIDGVAHRSTLEAGGRTIAVLGSGLDRIYPPEHRRLAQQIKESGAVITEYPLGTKPEGRNFPPRNRIISGLALAVVVVEAGEASGALITASFAADQGRDVFAVPGSIYSPTSKGCHKLIQAGALILTKPQDVIEALNLDIVVRQELAQLELPEDDTERMVYQALANDPIHVDDLIAQCDLPTAKVTSALAMLELKGRVRQIGGMHYMKAREPMMDYKVE